jgi:hypothetical protein
MNRSLVRWKLAGALALGLVALLSALPAQAQEGDDDRQYYTAWKKHPKAGYYYRQYCYKQTCECTEYHHHYVIYYPQQPSYCYYYNPYEKEYWGRCSTDPECEPEARWSSVPEDDRVARLEKIPESSFESPGEMPAIPDSDDGVAIEAPPNDLPEVEPGPAVPGGPAPAAGPDGPSPVPGPQGPGGVPGAAGDAGGSQPGAQPLIPVGRP